MDWIDVFIAIVIITVIALLIWAGYMAITQNKRFSEACQEFDGYVKLELNSSRVRHACYAVVDGQYVFYAIEETR